MSEQPTHPPVPGTLGSQMPALQTLVALADFCGSLPTPYITVSGVYANHVDLQLDNPADFEVWRTALQIPPAAVELHAYRPESWLAATTVVRGITVVLAGHGLLLAVEDARKSPVEDAQQRAASVDAQRYEVEHEAEPPLAVALVEVRPLADMPGGAM